MYNYWELIGDTWLCLTHRLLQQANSSVESLSPVGNAVYQTGKWNQCRELGLPREMPFNVSNQSLIRKPTYLAYVILFM